MPHPRSTRPSTVGPHGRRAAVLAGAVALAPVAPGGAADEVRCVDVPAGAAPPAYGCVNLGHRTGLTFPDSLVTWRLHRFATRAAAGVRA